MKYLIFALLLPFIAVSAFGESLSVKVREVKLRAAPQFWSVAVAGLKYGDSVAQIGEESGWYKVKNSEGKVGFLHPSSVTDRRVVLTASKGGTSRVDRSEVVMAGKGFNKEIEQKYAGSGENLAYGDVDAMERVKVSDADMASFIKAGKLGTGGLK